jgi:hypothetical protein
MLHCEALALQMSVELLWIMSAVMIYMELKAKGSDFDGDCFLCSLFNS